MIKIHLCESPGDLIADASPWDRLAGGVPFRQSSWLNAWWRQFGDEKRAVFVVATDDAGRLRGVLPLERDAGDRRLLRTIAAGNVCTDHVSVLVKPEDRESVVPLIAGHLLNLARHPVHGWDRIDFDGTLAGDEAMEMLLECLHENRVRSTIHTRMNIWFNVCDDSWDTYLANRSRRFRHRVRASLRKIDDSKGEWIVRDASSSSDADQALLQLIQLHQKRWQEVGEPGTYADERMQKFIRDTTLELCDQGRLYLPQLIYRGEVVASELHYIGDDGRQYCYSTGVDHGKANLSPGNLLNAYVIREAHEQGRAGIDYMRGDEPYKDRLHAQPVPLLEITVFANHWRGFLRATKANTIRAIKQLWRRFKKRPLEQPLSIDEAFDECHRRLHPQPRTSLKVLHASEPELNDASSKPENAPEAPVVLSIADYRSTELMGSSR